MVSGHRDSLVAADIAAPPAPAAATADLSSLAFKDATAAAAAAATAAAAAASPSLLATASYDGTVQVTNLATGAAMAVLAHPHPPTALAFSPGGGGHLAVAMEDGHVVSTEQSVA